VEQLRLSRSCSPPVKGQLSVVTATAIETIAASDR